MRGPTTYHRTPDPGQPVFIKARADRVGVGCAVRLVRTVGGQGDGVDAEATPDTGGTQRLTWWSSFAIIATLASVWTFAVPLMDSPDEPTHAIKAAAVARGELTTSYTNVMSGFGIRPVTDGARYLAPTPT